MSKLRPSHRYHFNLFMSEEELEGLKELAEIQGVTVKELILTYIEWGIENDTTPKARAMVRYGKMAL